MSALAVALLCWVIGGVAALLLRRRAFAAPFAALATVAGGAAQAFAAVSTLRSGVSEIWSFPWTLPVGALAVRLDPLAAVFLLPAAVVGGLGAIYGVAYLRRHAHGAPIGGGLAAYQLLLVSISLVVTANDLVLFLIAWELMTLSSWALVVTDQHVASVRAAGLRYLVASHFATAALFLFALSLSTGSGTSEIAALSGEASLPRGVLFLLATLGFGTKAAMVPLHVWLPDAHAAAPAHVSALMSAVMVTMGFYGLARFLPVLGEPAGWWAYVFLALGAAGAIGGVVFALAERDVKRVLAYSTVENAGIATLALGLGVLGTASGSPVLAGFGWTAALLHLWNHALAKATLFLGFGAVAQGVGSRSLDAMGGLLQRWAGMGMLLIAAAAALSSLPGLNVFVGEWILARGLLLGGVITGGAPQAALLAGVVVLALTGGLAVACFVRLVGLALLGTPRSEGAAVAVEPGWEFRGPMLALLTGCVAIAAFPGPVAGALRFAVATVAPGAEVDAAVQASRPLATLPLVLVGVAVVVAALRWLAGRRPEPKRSATWGVWLPRTDARHAVYLDFLRGAVDARPSAGAPVGDARGGPRQYERRLLVAGPDGLGEHDDRPRPRGVVPSALRRGREGRSPSAKLLPATRHDVSALHRPHHLDAAHAPVSAGRGAVILLLGGVVLVLAGGFAAVSLGRRRALGEFAFGVFVTGGCVVIGLSGVRVLAGAEGREVTIQSGLPGGPWVFGVDALSALFLVAIAAVGGASALFGVGYLRSERDRRPVGAAHLLVAVLICALVFVVSARAAMPFLIAWEMMALAAYALVVFEHERAEIRRAGLLYLVAAHATTLALVGLFAAWSSGTGVLTFDALAERAPALPANGSFVFALALVGFGLKAGIVPLHFWLPEAHAAAPSHVSALMSGIVIKTGIYGLLRVSTLLGSPPAWSGWLLLGLGVASGVLGVVWALAQHDLKRLLAYHSVENIGIILLGAGAGVLGVAYGSPSVAILGFAGASLHTLNHALFKGLLFLGAGSIAHGTGTRQIDRLGGLARRMPATATAFLIGSAAIVGLPPLNGFVSELLVFRSLIRTGLGPEEVRPAVLAAAALALIGALALACFAKVFGVVFLGAPRTEAAERAHESPAGVVGPLWVLAGACMLIGLVPALVVAPVVRVGALVAGVPFTSPELPPLANALPLTAFTSSFALGIALLWLALSLVRARRSAATTWTWGCGYSAPAPRMQYTASSFAAPLLAPFKVVSGLHEERTPQTFATHAMDQVLERLLVPGWHRLRSASALIRPFQRSRLSTRLFYMEVVLIALLLYLLLGARVS